MKLPKFSVKTRKSKIISAVVVILLLGAGTTIFQTTKDDMPIQTAETMPEPAMVVKEKEVEPEKTEEKPVAVPKAEPEPQPEPESQWPVTYTASEAASITVVVNKKHKLPSTYAPSLQSVSGGQLRPEAANALGELLAAASADGVSMRIISSYRSYATQVSTYNKWVSIDGKAQADRSSARAGHSEHQTGLAVDLGTPDSVCDLEICFSTTAQGEWLKVHASDYGFIVRYESDTEAITGYQYEPWHMRYLGVEVAKAVKASGQTLDEYYGVEAGGY